VSALKMDGPRVRGSREIARALESPEPPLSPVNEEARRAVEQAARWGEQEL
jgi:hypothetical protein